MPGAIQSGGRRRRSSCRGRPREHLALAGGQELSSFMPSSSRSASLARRPEPSGPRQRIRGCRSPDASQSASSTGRRSLGRPGKNSPSSLPRRRRGEFQRARGRRAGAPALVARRSTCSESLERRREQPPCPRRAPEPREVRLEQVEDEPIALAEVAGPPFDRTENDFVCHIGDGMATLSSCSIPRGETRGRRPATGAAHAASGSPTA